MDFVGLGEIVIHAGGPANVGFSAERVGSERYDRYATVFLCVVGCVVLFVLSDTACGFVSVHYGEMAVHEDGVKVCFLFFGCDEGSEGLPAVLGRFVCVSKLSEKGFCDTLIDRVVFNNKYSKVLRGGRGRG